MASWSSTSTRDRGIISLVAVREIRSDKRSGVVAMMKALWPDFDDHFMLRPGCRRLAEPPADRGLVGPIYRYRGARRAQVVLKEIASGAVTTSGHVFELSMRRRRRGQTVVTSVSGPDALIRDGEPPPTMHSGQGLYPRHTIQYTARSANVSFRLPMRLWSIFSADASFPLRVRGPTCRTICLSPRST